MKCETNKLRIYSICETQILTEQNSLK